MIIDCAHYREGRRQHDGPMALEDAAQKCVQGVFVWLGMFQPSAEELEQVRAAFGQHELAVEDAQTYHLRPKFERYEDGISFVILRTARYDDEREQVEFGEISIFLGPGFVITVRQAAQLVEHFTRNEALLASSSYAMLRWKVRACASRGMSGAAINKGSLVGREWVSVEIALMFTPAAMA